jgi:Plasmid recombination enzyme
VREKIGSQKIRSDAVLAVEILLSASPEYFRPDAPQKGGIYEQQRLDDFVDAAVKWLKKSWGDRIVQAELHLDEITPHIHAYLVPLDERGKLNCKALFGTRVKMYELQDSFVAAVAHLGIVRGVKGSVATHEKVRKYYSAVNQSSQILDWERLIPQPEPQESSEKYRQRVIELLNPQLEIINCQLSERDRILQQKTEWKETASRSEELRQKLEKELRVLKLEQQDLPLEAIAYELGINPNEQFHGDALDLVMRINFKSKRLQVALPVSVTPIILKLSADQVKWSDHFCLRGLKIGALLNPSMNHAIASSLRALRARSATEPYLR